MGINLLRMEAYGEAGNPKRMKTANTLKRLDTLSKFPTIFAKENNLCDFLAWPAVVQLLVFVSSGI